MLFASSFFVYRDYFYNMRFLEEIYKSCDITKSNKENRQIANGKVLKNIPGY